MSLAINVQPIKPISFQRKKVNKNSDVSVQVPSFDTKKIARSLFGLALVGTAAVGIAKGRSAYLAKRIYEKNTTGISIANYAVKNLNSRGKEAADIYRGHIAAKKIGCFRV